jgi:2-polyprenyl-3-methyl-5-hydroxy-6-metoxy-1,4-benzoquinol methylase
MAATGTVVDTRDVPRRRTLRTTLYDLYFRAEKIITPHLRSSQYAYYDALTAQLSPSRRWLDMGCGHQVFAEWMTREQEAVVARSRIVAGIDLDWAGLRNHTAIDRRVFGDLSRLPFTSGSWDVISANMVMEHLEDPDAVLREVHRTLSPQGTFVFHTPNFYHWGTLVARALPDGMKKRLIRLFEGRVEADVFETHYRVNTEADIRRRAHATGFEVLQLRHVNSSATLKMLGPIVLLELLYIRLIEHPRLAPLRSGLVVTLRKLPAQL